MTTKGKFKRDDVGAIHSAVVGMRRAGMIDKAAMRDFDAPCLIVPSMIEPARIKPLRESHPIRQPVFARPPVR